MKVNYGEKVGTCSVCTINLWSGTGGKPCVWPCNLKGCPYEDSRQQNLSLGFQRSATGSGLAQID